MVFFPHIGSSQRPEPTTKELMKEKYFLKNNAYEKK